MSSMSGLICHRTQKKYSASKSLNLKGRKNSKKNAITLKFQESIQKFLERDENSIMAPGIKDCIMKKKISYRKRYLTENLDALHKKYNENEPLKVSR